MDMHKLFDPVRNTEMPDEMRLRILTKCRNVRHTTAPAARKIIAAAAIMMIAIYICALGTEKLGFFRDIKNSFGAVTGTEYMNATEEIRVSARTSDGKLCIVAEFILPGSPPYAYVESLSVSDFRILDAAGNTICTGTETEPATIFGGQALIEIPTFIPQESMSIIIDSFTAFKKADAPIKLYGTWKCKVDGT